MRFGSWFYYFIRFFVGLYICTKFRIKVEGKENIPKENGFLMACNHVYGFDPFLLSMGTHRVLRFLGKAELSNSKHWGWFFKALGTVSVERGNGDYSVIDECAKVISNGEILVIFPEGTRSKGNGIGRPKSGMAVIAKTAQADILPCAIEAPANITWGDHITVRFGKLIPYESLEIDVNSPRTLKSATRKVWSEITEMAGEEIKIEQHEHKNC